MRFKLTMLAVLAGTSLTTQATNLAHPTPFDDHPVLMAQATGMGMDGSGSGGTATGNDTGQKSMDQASPYSTTGRAEVRSEAAAAARSGSIATGDEPVPSTYMATWPATSRASVRAEAARANMAGAVESGENKMH